MTEPSTVFEAHRPRLLRLAHHMLGSSGDAEDVVQDAYLRWHQTDVREVRTPEAWLVTVVTRLALDRLRAVQTERKAYRGPWLPEPWWQGASAVVQPDASSHKARELDYAALVLLERLSADERAAYLLHDIFDVDYAHIADALSKTEDACRQLVHRARSRVVDERRRHDTSTAAKADLLRRLQAALETPDETALAALFAPDSTLTSDGGGKVFASRSIMQGPARIAQLLAGVARKGASGLTYTVVNLGGEPALVGSLAGAPYSVTWIDAGAGGIQHAYRLLNPDKLRQLTQSRA